MRPSITLKPEHEHQKKKSQSLALQPKQSPLQSQIVPQNDNPFGVVPAAFGKANDPKIQLESEKNIQKHPPLNANDNKIQQLNKKQATKTQKQLSKQQQKPKKQQKPLKVQIIKKSSSQQPAKSLQTSVIQQPQQKGKKKKKKKQPPAPVEEISPQQRLKSQTHQLYSQCIQRHKIPYNYDHPELMRLLKQSYTPFAFEEIQQQRKIITEGEDPSVTMNTAKQYNLALFDQLNKRKHFHQDRIYLGVLEENQLFNDLIWRQEIQSQPKKQQVSSLFNEIHMLVINDVWQGEYEIRNKQKASKDEIIYGSYKANQIKLAESIIKEKLSSLNEEFTINVEGDDNNDASKFMKHRKFDLNSEETKKAEEFVKKLQQQEKLLKQRARKLKEQQEQELIKKLEEQREQQKRQQEQKIQQRKVKLMEKAEQRERQKKYRQQQQKQYQEYLSEHREKTPLFKKREQDFKAFLVKQQMKKYQALKQVQKHKRVISKEEIQLHQMKYRQLKQLLEEERQQLQKLQQQQADDRYVSFYKGKFHDSVVSEMERKALTEEKRDKAASLYSKKVEYATIVKSKFVPKIDLKKKEELQMLINDLKPKTKDDKLLAEKTKMQGYRNLQKLHQLMGQMRAKGKLKKPQTPQLNTSQQNSSRYINYLNDVRTSRMKNSSTSTKQGRFTSLDVSKLNRNSLGTIQLQARHLQHQADRKSLFLKNTKNLDIEDYLDKKFELQDDYIESAKVKMKVLSKYEMGDQ